MAIMQGQDKVLIFVLKKFNAELQRVIFHTRGF